VSAAQLGHIDTTVPVAAFRQVAECLREAIHAGNIAGRLPAEAQLAAHYGVSGVVIRAALRLLQEAGLVTFRWNGWGRDWSVR